LYNSKNNNFSERYEVITGLMRRQICDARKPCATGNSFAVLLHFCSCCATW